MPTKLTSCPPSLTFCDGQRRVGYLIRHGDSFEAFDINGTSCGVFADMKPAAFALPAANAPSTNSEMAS